MSGGMEEYEYVSTVPKKAYRSPAIWKDRLDMLVEPFLFIGV